MRLIESSIAVVQMKAQQKNIAFHVSCEPGLPIYVDSFIFEQALINLLDNAVAYSPDNETIHIAVEASDRAAPLPSIFPSNLIDLSFNRIVFSPYVDTIPIRHCPRLQ